MNNTQIVIGIPGVWKSGRVVLEQLLNAEIGRYTYSEGIIFDKTVSKRFQFTITGYDSELLEAYKYASVGRIDEGDLNKISDHRSIIYLITDTGTIDDIRGIIQLGAKIIDLGGIAVKIETTGRAYSKNDWLLLHNNLDLNSIYDYFVTYISDGERYYTCGMKSFGLPDTILKNSNEEWSEDVYSLLVNFSLYNIVENPQFADGDKFSLNEGSGVYRVTHSEDFRYDESHVFYNCRGLLELELL
ncbi:DUF4261 domain-containing protein [Mechercharimyces sp. CAU 1602]|uniref:DUF4261 domain-containing protein n=1 Tax=Mechercharimyces sp. CAU 1602 TaxID=2973933 RepID=UPI00216248D9|nr:DUF4261 domain-containing protein [Mechercharimyces sp. CAU 1602]MCS1350228.1 DUF4261 domain-containing protein [Mechercharimyces sp. CAU 1602]